MITEVYSIFDVKAASFGVPFYAPRRELAIRNVTAVVRDSSPASGMLSKFPEDFVLYFLGSFDDDKGVFDLATPCQVVCNLSQLKEVPNAQQS